MINTLIFDFGDVFINLDKPAIERSMNKLGISTITNEMLEIAMNYEKGLISTDVFITSFTKKFPMISNKEFTIAWNSIILDFPEHRLTFIEHLASLKKYKLILLSNTNELHIEQVIENMSLDRYLRFKNCFDQFYLSHEIKLRKPDHSIYEFVLIKNNLIAKNCFFIDDTKENTDAASILGIRAWNNNPKNEDVIDLFNNSVLKNS
ncbi:MAG: HAD-IA family hydrolase [Flavobacteriales bacterium]|jgi:glucose-1-phosphatase|tara:strand:+ start:1676 stop:2293 length:618 start_codon:yes stop_codon:yes gene_type:complete